MELGLFHVIAYSSDKHSVSIADRDVKLQPSKQLSLYE